MTDFIQEQDRKLDGARENKTKRSSSFKKKRFYLDTAMTKDDFQGKNLFEFPFKSFWVVETNSSSFVASMVVNHRGDGGDSLPLKLNMSIPFEYRQAGCAVECPAQPGVWIDIIFAFDSDITPGFVSIASSGSTSLSEGSVINDNNVSLNATGNSVLLIATSSRKKAIVQNNSGMPIWIGTATSLAHADYRKKCFRLESSETFEWKNAAQLNGRVEAGTTDEIAVMELT